MKNVDSFLSQKLQEADKKIEKYEEIIHEGKRKHQALENEIQRKDEALRNLHSTLERNTEKEYSEKQDLNKALHQQRKEFQKQYDILNEQLELKRQECVNLVNELNLKDQQLRDRGVPTEVVDFDIRKIKDENNKLSREIMICRDEANKFKMHLGQAMKEIDTYKSSIHSYELQCEKLKHLNNELNNTLSEERSINMKGRSKVKDQMVKISSKVEELEEYSANMENTNRDYSKKADYIMQKLCTLKEYIFSNEMPTSRNNKTPGTVRSNISGMISSCSKNPLEFNCSDDSADFITNEIRLKFDELKTKVFNYQSAINKLQGEKQQMYQSMNQLKYESVQEYSTPLSKNQNSLYKNKSQVATSTKDSENKSEAMIEYLRAEVTHLREKNRSLESELEMMKCQSEVRKSVSSQITDFMAGLLKPAKDLIYQLCSDPHLSESYFYTEDEIFEGIDSKYCLDIVKLFDVATERIVDLRSTLDQKEQIIRELDKKIIEIKLKYDQILQQKQKQEQSMNKEIEINFEGLDTKCREFASNLKILAGELEKEKAKCERFENENKYLKEHIKNKLESTQNQEILEANIESRVRIAREEGIRQGRREGILDSKVNEYIEQYKKEIVDQSDKIVQLEESIEKLDRECMKLRQEVNNYKKQISSERNLQKSLSKEIEDLTNEVRSLKKNKYDE